MVLIRRKKYRKLRSRVSPLAYYCYRYMKKFPRNYAKVFRQLKIDSYFLEMDSLKQYKKIPFFKMVFLNLLVFEKLTYYAKVSRKLRSSLHRGKPIKRKKKRRKTKRV